MSERHFEQSMNPNEHIQSELEDSDINHSSEWRKDLDLETPLEGSGLLKVEQRETRIETKESKIDSQNWQRQLDIAFEQGDYSLIQTLRMVRPESIPNIGIIRNKLNELVVSRPSEWVEDIKKINSIVNIQADYAIVSQEFEKLFEQFGQEENILDKLKTFKEATGYNPDPEAVQAGYRSILAGKKSDNFDLERLFKDIKNLTGIKPDSSIISEMLRQGDLDRAKKIASLFEIEITSEMVQPIYEEVLEKIRQGDVDRAKKIASLFEIEITSEMVQPIYEDMFEKKGYLDSRFISEIGEKPNIDLVQRAYHKILEDRRIRCVSSILSLREATGIQPIFTEEQLHPFFEEQLHPIFEARIYNSGLYRNLKKVVELTGIRPDIALVQSRALELIDKIINDEYFYTDRGERIKDELKRLSENVGFEFKIPEYEIQNRYQKALVEKKPYVITNLYGAFEIKPSVDRETARQFMVELMDGTYHNFIPKLEKVFDVKFKATPEEIEIKQDENFEKMNFDGLAKIKELTGEDIDGQKLEKALYRWLEKEATVNPDKLGSIYNYFKELFKRTDIKPEIYKNQLQIFYRGCLAEYSFNGQGIYEIEKIADMTGVKPEFDKQDINQLYKQLILNGREDRIIQISEVTNIEPEFDEETLAQVHQEIEAIIEKVRVGDYEKKESNEKEFDTHALEQDLEKISDFTDATGVKPDIEKLQSAYSKILVDDLNWATKIEKIVKATGIKPIFSSEQLQAKGQKLLEKGKLSSFERLQQYGQFTFTKEIVAKTYNALLATNRRYDQDYKKHYYNAGWVNQIKRFKEMTGIAPTEAQFAKIFSYILQDEHIAKSKYSNHIEEVIKFFIETFQTEITAGIVKDIAIFYLSRDDVKNMKKFIEKVGVTPELTDEDLLPHVNRLFEARELNTLAYLKQEMKLARVLATETVIQSTYQYFASQGDFGRHISMSLQAFKQVFELTGVSANLPAEQTDRVYKTTHFKEWQELSKIMGTLPSYEVVQYKYLQLFTENHYGLDKGLETVRTLTSQSPDTETISKALTHFALEGKIEEMSNIIKVAGGKPVINSELGQAAYRIYLITKKYDSIVNLSYGLAETIGLLNDTLGIRPDNETIYRIYSKTIGAMDYINGYKGPDGKLMYPQFWEFLIKKFGKPDPEVVQRIYLAKLVDYPDIMKAVENFNYIERFTGEKPDIKEMARIEKERGVEIEESQIDARLQNLFQQELLQGKVVEIGKLEEQFGRPFEIEPANLQFLYTRILMEKGQGNQRDIFRFLLDRTGVAPSQEIIQARYRELFTKNFEPEDIGAFQEMVKVPPSNEIVQNKYREVFAQYIENDSPSDDNNNNEEDEHIGDQYFEQYVHLIQATGIRPQFDRDYALKLYEFCIASGSEYHQKIGVIAQETGVAIDQDFIQKYLLDNPEFYSPVPQSISDDQLNKHFSNSQNTSLREYIRIYQIFGCFDYYQGVLAELEQDESQRSKQQVIALLTAMGLRDIENEERYTAIRQKLMTFVGDKSTPINKYLGEALSELAKNGDTDLLSYLASTLRERTKVAKDKEGESGVLGFSPIQEVSLRTFFHVDNPVANEHLLALLSISDIDHRVRSLILNNLITEKRGFFPNNMQTWAEKEFTDKKSKFPWEDLSYFQATIQIPSADLRKKSLRYLNDAFGAFTETNTSPSELQRKVCGSAPDNIFLSLWQFTLGDQVLLEKFNSLYQTIKTSTEKDALLFGIVNALSINKTTLEKVIDRLREIDLLASGNTQELSTVLKTLSFLDTVEQRLGQSREETLTILNSSVESLNSLNESLKQVAVQKIKEVLSYEGINADAIQSLWECWGNLEPIFVYAGKMASDKYDGTLRLVAEMVANMDAPRYEGWKHWRYNPQDREVREQIGYLTEQQLEVWKDDHFAELGDVMIAATPSDKPKKISRFIEMSLREGHIYNPQTHTSDRHKFIQEKLSQVYTEIKEYPNQRETILNGAIELLQADIEKIDTIIRFSNLPKLEQALTLFPEGKNVQINAKTKNSIGFLAQFLPKEQFQGMEKVYKEAEKNESSTIETSRLIDSTTREFLMTKMEEIKRKYEEVLQSNLFEQYGLDKEKLKNVGQFYQKRKELKALLDLYRVSALDVKRIATNRISNRVDKKGETLTKVIESLKIYFEDNLTFIQDIENVQAVISQREDFSVKRRLAMIVTDSPQMLFQVGKYPTGCGSCQNYEGSTDWNKALAAYIADSHIKVSYLIDLNKLPDSIKQEIETRGFEEVKDSIPHQNLLEASLARAITKITKISENSEPTLFIEPTYSSINKEDLTMDKYFNIFLELMVSEPMGIRLTRGGGSETVLVPKSRNPSGQYEDCAAEDIGYEGTGIKTSSYTMPARFIDKFTPVTDTDRQLAERISGE